MGRISVSVVTCLYGDSHQRFLPGWLEAVAALHSPPMEVIVAADRHVQTPGAQVIVSQCDWTHPQAWHLQQAFDAASSEWVWIVDLDDLALPDGLDGLEHVDVDVWQMGYLRTDGLEHIPPRLTAAEYLALPGNPYTAGSAIRVAAFHGCGGFRDVAFQDWGLWRRMARLGMRFEPSGRAHYRYTLHPDTRSARELMPTRRSHHYTEMLANG